MNQPTLPTPAAALPAGQRFNFSCLLAALLYLLVAAFYVERGLFNGDEGLYVVMAHEAAQGKLPYRDFAYTQMPLMPYLQGAIMSVTGFGVREQRWINATWSALALAIAFGLWRRLGVGTVVCMATALVWSFCQPLVYYNTIGKTYAPAQFWLVAAGLCLFLRVPPLAKLLLFSVAGVLAIGCRLTVVPAVGVLWIGLCVGLYGKVSRPLLVGVPVLLALIAFGPFFAADLQGAIFWTWEFHSRGTLARNHLGALWKSVLLYPAAALLAGISLASVFKTKGPFQNPATWVLLAGVSGWMLGVSLGGIWLDYAAPFLPLTLMGAGILWENLRQASPAVFRFSVVAAILCTAAGILEIKSLTKPGYLQAVDQTTSYVRAHTRPGDIVLASMAEIPLQSGREIIPGLEMGHFGITTEFDEKGAARLRIITFDQLLGVLEKRRVPMVVLSQKLGANFTYSLPSLAYIPAYPKFNALLDQNYTRTYSNSHFMVYELARPEDRPEPAAHQ